MDEDGEETLVNPTLVEQEKWSHNVDLRKKKAGYNPYADEETDEWGDVSVWTLGISVYGKRA